MPKGQGPRPYRQGNHCWYIDYEGYWFDCVIVRRTGYVGVIQSHTGFDSRRVRAWPHPDGLEISLNNNAKSYKRLRAASVVPPAGNL